jgi:hypothetical protein
MLRRALARISLLAAIGALALGGVPGCAKKLLPPATGDQPPHTTLFIQVPAPQLPDTVNHLVHLYWYGNDADGYVRSFRVKVVNPADPVAADSAWTSTTAHDSLFTIYTPSGYTVITFEVAAVDDKGLVDPTPAIQRFQFKNQPPVLKLTTKPSRLDKSDTTYAAVTIAWSISDPDGDASKVKSYVWLDHMSGPPIQVSGSTFTVPSESFKVNGVYTSGPRTLYLQGVDDGGMAGPIDSVSWYVRQPAAGARARVLFIDETALNDPLHTRNDTTFTNAVARLGVPANQTSMLWLAKIQPFRTSQDLYQTMKLFETVVWFNGRQTSTAFSSVLLSYRDGIGRYLDEGGKVYLETQSMVAGLSSTGPLDQAFASTYLNCDGVFQWASPPDSSASYGMNNGSRLYAPQFGANAAVGDSTQTLAIIGYLRAFRTRDGSQAYLVARPGTLTGPATRDSLTFPVPVALNVPTRHNGMLTGGRLIASTFPIAVSNRGAQVATNIMRQMGLDQP